MNARHWAICTILATVLANTGCITPCHKGYEQALKHGAECDLPVACRGQVYVFMMHGLTPTTHCGLNSLRLKLAENGFAKIGMGELCHANWVKTEIDTIRACEPEARFVLVGYDLGGGAAVSVARELQAKGIAVEAVVLLDPLGCPKETCGVPTLLITSGKTSVRTPHSSRIVVPDSTHFSLPAHATTVAAITDLLREIAAHNCAPETETITEWSYPHAPEMRATPSATNTKNASQWNFLADRPNTTRPIQTHLGTHTAASSAQPAAPATHAGPVVIKP